MFAELEAFAVEDGVPTVAATDGIEAAVQVPAASIPSVAATVGTPSSTAKASSSANITLLSPTAWSSRRHAYRGRGDPWVARYKWCRASAGGAGQAPPLRIGS